MLWLGIGVTVIGVALLIISIILIKPLGKVSNLLDSLKVTTDKLPDTIDNVTSQATDVLHTTNSTINDVNGKVAELTPVFEILGDAGRASQKISLTAVEATDALKTNVIEGKHVNDKESLNGFYGLLSLGYYLYEKRKTIKETLKQTSNSTQ